jgi:hypothetical protein
MALNAQFTIEGTTVPQSTGLAVEIDYGETVNLALLSTSGLTSVSWEIFGTSSNLSSSPTITSAGVPSGATASFVAAANQLDTAGISYGVCCTVSDGTSTARSYGVVGVPNRFGLVPPVAGEELARHATQGWTRLINDVCLRLPNEVVHATSTDSSVVKPITIPIPTNKVLKITTQWTGYDATAGDRLIRESVSFYKNVSGTVSLMSSTHVVVNLEEDATWTPVEVINGSNVDYGYGGDATNPVDWYISVWTDEVGN